LKLIICVLLFVALSVVSPACGEPYVDNRGCSPGAAAGAAAAKAALSSAITSADIDAMVVVDGNPSTMHKYMKSGNLHITDSVHGRRYVKLNVAEMRANLEGFDGHKLGITHIADNGKTTRWIEYLGISDKNGFITLDLEFSETIISGFTGFSQWTITNHSGNWSAAFDSVNISSIDAVITPAPDFIINGESLENRSLITINGSMVTTETNLPIMLKVNLPGCNDHATDVRTAHLNGTPIAREIEWKWSNDDVSLYLPFNTVSSTNSQFYIYWGNSGLTEPAASSTYGSQAVWDSNYIAVWNMNNDPNGDAADSIKDSTNNGYDGTPSGSMTTSDLIDTEYGKGIVFDGVDDVIDAGVANLGAVDMTLMTGLNTTRNDDLYFGGWGAGPGVQFSVGVGVVNKLNMYSGSSSTRISSTTTVTDGVSHNTAFVDSGSTMKIYVDDGGYESSGNAGSLTYSGWNLDIGYIAGSYEGNIEYVRVSNVSRTDNYIATTHKNLNNPTATGTTPFYKTIGATETRQGAYTFTMESNSVTDTDTIDSGNTATLTIAPLITDSICVNTTSPDWSATVTAYNTVNTTKYSEASIGGYANMTVLFTPLGGVTNGTINATYTTITFDEHDYTGSLLCTIDGVEKSATLTGQDVSVPVVLLNDSEHTILFSIPYNPAVELLTPLDSATLSYSYPPLTHDVTFTWEQTTGHYKYEIYEGPIIKTSGTTTTNTSTLPLPAGDYSWLIYGYDDIFNEYSAVSDTYEFTINTTISYDNVTGVHGVIYEYLLGVETPLENAAVYLWNDTYSDSTITTTDGYYAFPGLNNTTYYLISKKDRYLDSNTEIVTLVTNNMTEHNIRMLENTGTDYSKHYVSFTVKSLWETKYSGVAATVYIGDTTTGTPYKSGYTGTDGVVAFEMSEAVQYTITFIDASMGIDEEITLYPVKDAYNIYVFDTILPEDEDIESEEITVTITTAEIDDDDAYINVTYLDAMDETTSLKMYINQSNQDDPVNQTVVTSVNLGGTSSVTHSFTVSDYSGQAYFVNIVAEHTIFGDVLRTYAVRFEGMADNMGFSRIWVYLGVGGMMFVGGLFKSSKAEQGALIVCIAGWIFVVMGWFDALGSTAVLGLKAGLGLATIIAIAANMAKKDRDETI